MNVGITTSRISNRPLPHPSLGGMKVRRTTIKRGITTIIRSTLRHNIRNGNNKFTVTTADTTNTNLTQSRQNWRTLSNVNKGNGPGTRTTTVTPNNGSKNISPSRLSLAIRRQPAQVPQVSNNVNLGRITLNISTTGGTSNRNTLRAGKTTGNRNTLPRPRQIKKHGNGNKRINEVTPRPRHHRVWTINPVTRRVTLGSTSVARLRNGRTITARRINVNRGRTTNVRGTTATTTTSNFGTRRHQTGPIVSTGNNNFI